MTGGAFNWGPGEFIDDTQMAIVQAESLLACGSLDGADLFARFQQWMDGPPKRGITRRLRTSRAPAARWAMDR